MPYSGGNTSIIYGIFQNSVQVIAENKNKMGVIKNCVTNEKKVALKVHVLEM